MHWLLAVLTAAQNSAARSLVALFTRGNGSAVEDDICLRRRRPVGLRKTGPPPGPRSKLPESEQTAPSPPPPPPPSPIREDFQP